MDDRILPLHLRRLSDVDKASSTKGCVAPMDFRASGGGFGKSRRQDATGKGLRHERL
jgi:hypothetical protein